MKCKLCEAETTEELCEFCKNLNNQPTEKKTIKKIKYNPLTKIKTISLKCIKCNKVWKINTNNETIYTEEVINKWTCAFCTTYKNKEVATADDNHTKRIRND